MKIGSLKIMNVSQSGKTPTGGILTSGKDFFPTSGKKSNSHQWDRKFIPLVGKKYFPLVGKKIPTSGMKKEEREEGGGTGRKTEERGQFPMFSGWNLGLEAWT